MKSTLKIIVVFVLSLTISCQEERFTDKGFPEIKTTGVSLVEGGAVFSGNIEAIGIEEILGYGFLWSTSKYNSFEEFNKGVVGQNATPGPITYEATFDFEQNVTYYYRAYIQCEDFVSYGEMLTFVGQGSRK